MRLFESLNRRTGFGPSKASVPNHADRTTPRRGPSELVMAEEQRIFVMQAQTSEPDSLVKKIALNERPILPKVFQ